MSTGDTAIRTARYLDGKVAQEQEVTLTLSVEGMTIHTTDAAITWPRAEIELVDHLDRGARVRFSHEGEPNARVVVLGREAVERCHACWPEIFSNRRGGLRRDLKRLSIGVAGLAVAGAMAFAALPIIISILAALVPASTEKRIGDEAVADRPIVREFRLRVAHEAHGDGAARAPASDDARRRRVASDARIRDREFDLVVVSSRTHLYLATRKCGRAET